MDKNLELFYKESREALVNAGYADFTQQEFIDNMQDENKRHKFYNHLRDVTKDKEGRSFKKSDADADEFFGFATEQKQKPVASANAFVPASAVSMQSLTNKAIEEQRLAKEESDRRHELALNKGITDADREALAKEKEIESRLIVKPEVPQYNEYGMPVVSEQFHATFGVPKEDAAVRFELEQHRRTMPSYLTRDESVYQNIGLNAAERALNTDEGATAYNDILKKYTPEFFETKEYKYLVAKGAKQDEVSSLFHKMYGDKVNAEFMPRAMEIMEDYVHEKDTEWNAKTSAKGLKEHSKENDEAIDEKLTKIEQERAVQFGSAGSAYAAIGRQMNDGTNPTIQKLNNELTTLKSAKMFTDDAQKIFDAATKGEGFWKAFGKTLGSEDTWDLGLGKLNQSLELKAACDKLDKGEKLTKEEQMLVDAAVDYMAVSAYYSDKIGRGYKAGQTSAASIPFMLQFMATPLSGVESGIVKSLSKAATKVVGKKIASNAVAKTAGKFVANTIATAAEGAIMTATWGVPKVIEGAISRENGDIKAEISEDGKSIVYGGRKNQQSAGEAIRNSALDNFFENWSEMIFTNLTPLQVYSRAAGMFKGLKNTELIRAIQGARNVPWLRELRQRGQFSGIFGETMEEEVGGLLRLAFNSDVNSLQEAGLDMDSQIDIVLGLAPTSLVFGGVGTASYYGKLAINAEKYRASLDTAEEKALFDGIMKESREGLYGQQAHDLIRNILTTNTRQDGTEITNEEKKLKIEALLYHLQSKLGYEINDLREKISDPEFDKRLDKYITASKHVKDNRIYETKDKDGRVFYITDENVKFRQITDDEGNVVNVVDQENSPKTLDVRIRKDNGDLGSVQKVNTNTLVNNVGGIDVEECRKFMKAQHKAMFMGTDVFNIGSHVYDTNTGKYIGEEEQLPQPQQDDAEGVTIETPAAEEKQVTEEKKAEQKNDKFEGTVNKEKLNITYGGKKRKIAFTGTIVRNQDGTVDWENTKGTLFDVTTGDAHLVPIREREAYQKCIDNALIELKKKAEEKARKEAEDAAKAQAEEDARQAEAAAAKAAEEQKVAEETQKKSAREQLASACPMTADGEIDYKNATKEQALAWIIENEGADAAIAEAREQIQYNASKVDDAESKKADGKISPVEANNRIRGYKNNSKQWSDAVASLLPERVGELTAKEEVETPAAKDKTTTKGTSNMLPYGLSNELDENGKQFVNASNGTHVFGEITGESGLDSAPILLSEGVITNPQTNSGYGLVHIEARHGDQIRSLGYKSVVDFVEDVAKNYQVIKEGNDRSGNKTYLLQLVDKHNNTLIVELSGDGTYWNINTAGAFNTSYGSSKKVVYTRPTSDALPTTASEATQEETQGGEVSSSSRNNTPTPTSEGKDNAFSSNMQIFDEKNSDFNENSEKNSINLSSGEYVTLYSPTRREWSVCKKIEENGETKYEIVWRRGKAIDPAARKSYISQDAVDNLTWKVKPLRPIYVNENGARSLHYIMDTKTDDELKGMSGGKVTVVPANFDGTTSQVSVHTLEAQTEDGKFKPLTRNTEKVDKRFEKALSEAKTLDDALDYVVYSTADGRYTITMRDVLGMSEKRDRNGKLKSIGDQIYDAIKTRLMLNDDLVRQDIVDEVAKNAMSVFSKNMNNAIEIWNKVVQDAGIDAILAENADEVDLQRYIAFKSGLKNVVLEEGGKKKDNKAANKLREEVDKFGDVPSLMAQSKYSAAEYRSHGPKNPILQMQVLMRMAYELQGIGVADAKIDMSRMSVSNESAGDKKSKADANTKKEILSDLKDCTRSSEVENIMSDENYSDFIKNNPEVKESVEKKYTELKQAEDEAKAAAEKARTEKEAQEAAALKAMLSETGWSAYDTLRGMDTTYGEKIDLLKNRGITSADEASLILSALGFKVTPAQMGERGFEYTAPTEETTPIDERTDEEKQRATDETKLNNLRNTLQDKLNRSEKGTFTGKKALVEEIEALEKKLGVEHVEIKKEEKIAPNNDEKIIALNNRNGEIKSKVEELEDLLVDAEGEEEEKLRAELKALYDERTKNQQEIDKLNAKKELMVDGHIVTSKSACVFVVDTLRKHGIKVDYISEAQLDSLFGKEKMQALRDKNAQIYGYFDHNTGRIVIVEEMMNPNTPIHEYTHMWVMAYSQNNPKQWKKDIAILKKSDMWKRVVEATKNDGNYKQIAGDENVIASEVIARLTGNYFGEMNADGTSRFEEKIKENTIVGAIRRIWDNILNFFGVKTTGNGMSQELLDTIQKPIDDLITNGEILKDIERYKDVEYDADYMYESDFDSDGNIREEVKKEIAEERAAIERAAIESGMMDVLGHRYAPNGERSKLSKEQWITVRTKRFKDWFGDWENNPENASKVVDHVTGEPMPVYHGTHHEEILDERVIRKGNQPGRGIYTTDNAAGASVYSIGSEYSMTDAREELMNDMISSANAMAVRFKTGKPNAVFPLFSNMKNPMVVDFEGKNWDEYGDPVITIYEYAEVGDVKHTFNSREEAVAYCEERGLDPDVEIETTYKTTDEFVDEARQQGYDGCIFRNVKDAGYLTIDDYVALESNQLKSATKNEGTFSESRDRIDFMIGSIPSVYDSADVYTITPALEEEVKRKQELADQEIANPNSTMPDEIGRLHDLVYKYLDKTEGVRLFLKSMNDWRIKNGMSPLPVSKDIRNLIESADSVIANKVKEFARNERKELFDAELAMEELVKANKAFFSKYEEEKGGENKGKLDAKKLVERYLIARDTVERIEFGIGDRGMGDFALRMGVDELGYLKEFESLFGGEKLNNLWKAVKKCTSIALEEAHDSGLITDVEYERDSQRNFYVPERDFAAETEDDDFNHSAKNKSNQTKSFSFRTKGGVTLAANVIENIVVNTTDAYDKAQRNRVKNAMMDLMLEHEDFLKEQHIPVPQEVYLEKNPDYDPSKKDSKEYRVKKEGPTAEERKLMKDLQSQVLVLEAAKRKATTEDEKADIDEQIKLLKDMYPYADVYQTKGFLSKQEIAADTVIVYRNGIATQMQFPKLEQIATALNNTFFRDKAGNIEAAVGRVTGFVSSMVTTYNPAFFAVNMVRDVPFILSKGYTEFGPMFGVRFLANMKSSKIYGPVARYMSKENRLGDTEDDILFKEFLRVGGNTGYANTTRIEDAKDMVRRLSKGKPIESFEGLKYVSSYLSESSELWTRFAAFRAVVDGGGSIEEAGRAAKNLSVNFNRKAYGNHLVNFLNSFSMFANAAIQGTMGFYRMFDSPKHVRRAVVSFGAMPMILGWATTMLFPDDPDKEYAPTDFERDNNIVLGDIRIPLNEQMKPFWVIGVNIALAMKGQRNSKQIANSIISSVFTNLVPVAPNMTNFAVKMTNYATGQGETTLAKELQALYLPQGLQNINNVAENRNFMGSKLRYDIGDIPEWKMSQNEAAMYRDISYLMYRSGFFGIRAGSGKFDSKHTGDKLDKEVFFDINPKEIKAVMSFLPSTYVDLAAGAWAVGHAALTDDTLEQSFGVKSRGEIASKMPIVNRFWKPNDEQKFRMNVYREAQNIVKENTDVKSNLKSQVAGRNYNAVQPLVTVSNNVNVNALNELTKAYAQVSTVKIAKKFGMSKVQFERNYPYLDYNNLEQTEKEYTRKMLYFINEEKK